MKLTRYFAWPFIKNSRRIEKKVETTSNGSTWTLKNWEGYVYDAWNLIMTVRFETNGAVRGRVASYVWGPDIGSRAVGGAGSNWQAAGGVGGLLFVVDGSSVSAQYPASTEDAADDHFFPLMDRLGNVLAYAKVANATTPLPLRAVYDYDAFGRKLRSSGPAADLVPFHFSTKFTDQESGLNYYGYRYYDPGKGRWLSRDPIGENGGRNLYGMAGNSTPTRFDVLGKADYGILGARCCNRSSNHEHALVNGSWVELGPGKCTGLCSDCDGMTCGGYFYAETGSLAIIGGLTCSDGSRRSPRQGWTPNSGDAGFNGGESPWQRGLPQGDPIGLDAYPWAD